MRSLSVTSTLRAPIALTAFALALALAGVLGGCRPESASVKEASDQGAPGQTEATALTEQQAQELVSTCAQVAVVGVKLASNKLERGVATLSAQVPGTGDEAERVELRYDLAADRLLSLRWPDRMVFATTEPVPKAEAEKVARDLFDRFFPEVPARMVEQPTRKLNRPIFVMHWVGQAEGDIRTGDRAVAQVSSVTGLPFSYTQEIAPHHPDPADIKLTRKHALAAARRTLNELEINSDGINLEAELVLSSPLHPTAGPVWRVVAADAPTERRVLIDAMTGDALAVTGFRRPGSGQ